MATVLQAKPDWRAGILQSQSPREASGADSPSLNLLLIHRDAELASMLRTVLGQIPSWRISLRTVENFLEARQEADRQTPDILPRLQVRGTHLKRHDRDRHILGFYQEGSL